MDNLANKAREQMQSMGFSTEEDEQRREQIKKNRQEMIAKRGGPRSKEEKRAASAELTKTIAENVPVLGEAMLAKEIAGNVKDKDYTGAGLNTLALAAGVVPGPGKALSKAIRKFNKTRKAYKLAVQSEDKKLYPLFVNADKELPVGKWIEADFPDTAFTAPNGKVYVPTRGAKRTKGEKTKGTGDQVKIPNEETAKKLKEAGFPVSKPTKNAPHGTVLSVAARPGLHASQNPVATHLGPEDLIVTNSEKRKLIKAGVTPEAFKSKTFFYDENNKIVGRAKRKKLSKEELAKLKSKKVNYVKRRAEDQVFVEVEMADDVDYQSMLAKEGKTDINDRVPKGGSYRYSDGQADSDQWVVGGDMKITRVLSRAESKQLQKERGVVDLPYRDEVEEIIGRKFSKGGVVMDDYQLAKITDEPQNYATGGIAKQMEMFDDGGLMDEGGTVDPVSGNDVPPGSTQEEVRDDIPAQLSEGEFVFPADVVRFIGLEKLMKIRQRAKAGLQRMDDMGQMGNSEEAIMPDDLPFSIGDLDMEDDGLEMNQGGLVNMSNGGMIGQLTTGFPASTVNTATNALGTPIGSVGTFNPQIPGTAGMNPLGTAAAPMQAASSGGVDPNLAGTSFTPTTMQQNTMPTFQQAIGPGVINVDYEDVTFTNEAGQTIVLRRNKRTGEMMDPVPEGFTAVDKTKSAVETTTGTGVQTARVDEGGGDDAEQPTSGATASFGGEVDDRTGRVSGGYQGEISYFGKNAGKGFMGIQGLLDARGMVGRMGSGAINQITGGKAGTQFTLMPGERVEIKNLKVMRGPGVYGKNEPVIRAAVRLDDKIYNSLYASSRTVSGRKEMQKTVDFIRSKYGNKYLQDKKNVVDLGIEHADRKQQEEVTKVINRTTYSDDTTLNNDIKDTLTRNNAIGNVTIDSQGKASIINPAEASRIATAQAPDYSSRDGGYDPGSDDGGMGFDGGDAASGADDAMGDGGGSFGGNDDDDGGDYDDSFNRGGLAKQMKRSGLASKK